MRAALLNRYQSPIDITQVPDPACPRDGAVIAVRACGVCRSDHHAWIGADPDVVLPHVMGHEFAGEVIETGPECRAFRRGDRVTAPFILGCGACHDCRSGEPTICDHQQVIGFTSWGAFAERLAIARDLGATATLDAGSSEDVGGAVREITAGGAHVSLDALGITETFHNSLKSLRKMGRHVQIGMPLGRHASVDLPLLDLVYARQITLHGTRGIGAHRFAALFDMIAGGRLDPARLITKRIGLSGLNAALAAMDGYIGAGVTVVDDMAA